MHGNFASSAHVYIYIDICKCAHVYTHPSEEVTWAVARKRIPPWLGQATTEGVQENGRGGAVSPTITLILSFSLFVGVLVALVLVIYVWEQPGRRCHGGQPRKSIPCSSNQLNACPAAEAVDGHAPHSN